MPFSGKKRSMIEEGLFFNMARRPYPVKRKKMEPLRVPLLSAGGERSGPRRGAPA
jgi:hypothetical protein